MVPAQRRMPQLHRRSAMRGQLLRCCAWLLAVTAATARGLGQAPDEQALEQPIRQATTFLEALAEDSVDKPYNTLLENSPLAKDQDKVKKVIKDTKQLFAPNSQYGKPRAEEPIERVKAQRVGKDLAILRYLYKFDQVPVVWHFTFYRTNSNNKWVVVGVRFDHEYEALAE